jgi:hypothetical protein
LSYTYYRLHLLTEKVEKNKTKQITKMNRNRVFLSLRFIDEMLKYIFSSKRIIRLARHCGRLPFSDERKIYIVGWIRNVFGLLIFFISLRDQTGLGDHLSMTTIHMLCTFKGKQIFYEI